MLLDTQEMFSGAISAAGVRTAQAVTATAISANVLDLRNSSLPLLVDEGINSAIWFVVRALAAFNTLTSLTVTLESADDAGLSSNVKVHYSSGAVLLAALVANAPLIRVQLPSDDYRRYLGVRYTVGGANPTLGSVYAFLTLDIQRNLNYPSGFTLDV